MSILIFPDAKISQIPKKQEKLNLKDSMSKDKKTVAFEELAVFNTLEIQAEFRILERKGLITSDEVLQEVVVLKEEMDE